MRARLAAILTVVALGHAAAAHAQPIQYFFTTSTGARAAGDNFIIPAIGQTVQVFVFMHDTDAASSWFTGVNPQNSGTNLNPNQTANLNTFGLRSTQLQISSSAPGIARVNASADVSANPGFNFFSSAPPFNGAFSSVNAGAGTVQVQGTKFESPGQPGIAASVSPEGGHQVLIGSFVFTALASGTTTLTFSDFSTSQVNALATEPTGTPPPSSSNGGALLDATTLSPGTTIPGLFGFTATVTVQSVPEPTSLILGGVGLIGCGLVRRFRRKSQA
jgi:hypothetical protein